MQFISDEILEYSIGKSTNPSKLADELEKFTRENVEMSQMLIGKLEASFLSFLIRSLGVKKVLEFGTFTGYSALCMAEALPEDGMVHTIDVDETNVSIAKSFWEKSFSHKKIHSHIGTGLEVVETLASYRFDLVFIDADKVNYLNYLKKSLEILSDNGVVILDNVLWSGKVLTENNEESTKAIKEVNDYISTRDDLEATLLPVRDGMFLVRKLTA